MKPSSVIILVLLSIASISTASMLFVHGSPQPSAQRSTPPSTVEIKWGEGSEAGTPGNAADNSK